MYLVTVIELCGYRVDAEIIQYILGQVAILFLESKA